MQLFIRNSNPEDVSLIKSVLIRQGGLKKLRGRFVSLGGQYFFKTIDRLDFSNGFDLFFLDSENRTLYIKFSVESYDGRIFILDYIPTIIHPFDFEQTEQSKTQTAVTDYEIAKIRDRVKREAGIGGDIEFEIMDREISEALRDYDFGFGGNTKVEYYSIYNIENSKGCSGEELIIQGSNLLYENMPGQVYFPVLGAKFNEPEQKLEPLQLYRPIAHLSWTAHEIQVKIPDCATAGPVILKSNSSIKVTTSSIGTIVQYYWQASLSNSTALFTGGLSYIENFYIVDFPNRCFLPGETIHVTWSAVNQEKAHFQVKNDDGGLIYEQEFGFEVSTAEYVIPEDNELTNIQISIEIDGRCQTSKLFSEVRNDNVRIHKSHSNYPTALRNRFQNLLGQSDSPFENWFRNISFQGSLWRSESLTDLKQLVIWAEHENIKLRPMGSSWSYTNCSLMDEPSVVHIDFSNIGDSDETSEVYSDLVLGDGIIPNSNLLPSRLRLRNSIQSANPEREVINPDKLIRVKAGAKIYQIISYLDDEDLTGTKRGFYTLGGSSGQSIAGAINTSTHGSNPHLPPIADFVRAIHVVGHKGREWWVERRTNRISEIDPQEGKSSCITVEYDDSLFDALLVNLGSMGVIYSYVFEVREFYHLSRTTKLHDWQSLKTPLTELLEYPHLSPFTFFEVIMNSSGRIHLSTDLEIDIASAPDDTTEIVVDPLQGLSVVGLVSQILASNPLDILLKAIPDYIADVASRITTLTAVPVVGPALALKASVEELEPAEDFFNDLKHIIESVDSLGDGESGIRILTALVNILHRTPGPFNQGREIIDMIADTVLGIQIRPLGIKSASYYDIMVGGKNAPDHTFEKATLSFEFVLGPEHLIDFIEELSEEAKIIQNRRKALVYSFNLRFTRPTKALLGIQKYGLSCHVEIYLFKGIIGNEQFTQIIYSLASKHEGIPHWGQLHDINTDFSEIYGTSLLEWQENRSLITNGSEIFNSAFIEERGLI